MSIPAGWAELGTIRGPQGPPGPGRGLPLLDGRYYITPEQLGGSPSDWAQVWGWRALISPAQVARSCTITAMAVGLRPGDGPATEGSLHFAVYGLDLGTHTLALRAQSPDIIPAGSPYKVVFARISCEVEAGEWIAPAVGAQGGMVGVYAENVNWSPGRCYNLLGASPQGADGFSVYRMLSWNQWGGTDEGAWAASPLLFFDPGWPDTVDLFGDPAIDGWQINWPRVAIAAGVTPP